MSDSPELFELDSEEDDDIVTQRLRRADKARRSARKADSAPPETAQVSERGTPAPPEDDADSDFEIDPPDDDIFMRRRQPKAKAPAPAGTGRWVFAAIVVGFVVGGVIAGVLMADDDERAHAGTDQTSGVDMAQVTADIDALEAQVAQDPENYKAHVDLGGLLCRIGDSAGAFEHLTTATNLDPEGQEAWLVTGMCYASQDTAEAQRVLTKVVELDPGSDLGKSAQSFLDELNGGSTEPADGESP